MAIIFYYNQKLCTFVTHKTSKTMTQTTPQKLTALRQAMKKHGISAYIVPGTDPHASEYIADYWKEREWLSGFDGSAGTAAVTLEKAGLWTDSRYFLQGEEQLAGSGIDLMKQGLPETLDIIPWLSTELKSGEKVGVNPQMFSLNAHASMKNELEMSGIELVSADFFAEIWENRPALPKNPFFVFDVKYSGKSTAEKLETLRAEMQKVRADVFILSALDDIAWLFNIRGNDVSYNPVTIAYALVDMEKAVLFIDAEKITDESAKYLASEKIETAPYLDIYRAIEQISPTKSVLADGAKLNQSLFEAIPEKCVVRNTMSPVFKLKSIKNAVEMAGMNCAMVKDGVAMVRFLKWFEENLGKTELTEISVAEKLYAFRTEQTDFVGASFGTISGYAAHGAIVHYSATPETDAVLKQENLLLLDSGAQYFDGTTDITRTLALGTPTAQQKTDFTLVLKGHINLTLAVFPVGTRGSQLDILARKAMWDRYINYGHGTGHGIGHFLNVHEGPQSIRMDENPITLQPGMILSNEPGLYRANEYGIRIENLIHVIPAQKTEFGQFLQFETLTLCPIDKNLIDIELLTEQELTWLNNYHARVYEVLSKELSRGECEWLKEKCEAIE